MITTYQFCYRLPEYYPRHRRYRFPHLTKRRTIGIDLKMVGIVRHPFFNVRRPPHRFNPFVYNYRARNHAKI